MNRRRIVCFGDSNTWGDRPAIGGRFDDDVRWTGRLQALLGDKYCVIEEGQNGRTTVWDDPVENRLAGLTYLWPCMESHHPFELLIIMLGTNDTKCYFGAEAANITRSAGRLVDMASKSEFGPDGRPPQVLLVSPIHIENNPVFEDSFGAQAERKSRDFSRVFRAEAELLGCHFLDAAEFADPSREDGLHMDAANHAKLARAMFDKVKEIID